MSWRSCVASRVSLCCSPTHDEGHKEGQLNLQQDRCDSTTHMCLSQLLPTTCFATCVNTHASQTATQTYVARREVYCQHAAGAPECSRACVGWRSDTHVVLQDVFKLLHHHGRKQQPYTERHEPARPAARDVEDRLPPARIEGQQADRMCGVWPVTSGAAAWVPSCAVAVNVGKQEGGMRRSITPMLLLGCDAAAPRA